MKGPALFLAQFVGPTAPFDSLDGLAGWAAGHGYVGVQIPTNDPALFDLAQAAQSKSYCEDIVARLDRHGLQVTELSTHLQGQLVAVHPAYDLLFDGFAPAALRGKPAERQAWAVDQLKL
ncbi:sugar phosphate isomerase/epimerase, partial [Cupriavidus sp. 2MCAB6]